MGKRKEWHSYNQTMTSSFSFATLAKARAARLHCKGMLIKLNKIKKERKTIANVILINLKRAFSIII